jgi:hypothetical protein
MDDFCYHGLFVVNCFICSFKDGYIRESDFYDTNYLEKWVEILWPC